MNKYTIFLFFWLIFGLLACTSPRKAARSAAEKTRADSIDFARQRQNAMLFSDGLREKIVGQPERAIARFELALKAYPADHASMFELSELYFRKGRTDEALQMARQAAALDPSNEWYLLRLAQLCKMTARYDEMLQTWHQLIRLKPQRQEYYAELAQAYVAMGRLPEALEVLDQLETIAGTGEEISMQKFNLHLLNNDATSAIKEVEKLAAAFPFETRYQAMLADMYLKNGDTAAALRQYEKLREINPDDPNVIMSLAEFYKDQGDEEKAFQMLLEAFGSPALDIETKVQVMMLWFQGAGFSEELNEKAEQVAQTLLATHPESPRGHQLLGDVYLRRNEMEKAREQFEKAVEMEPGNYAAWETLLFTDIQLSDYHTLGVHATKALGYFPEQPLLYLFDGYAKYQKGSYEAALRAFETGRRLVVNNDRLLAEFFSSIGDTQHKLKNHEASDAAYEKALTINPANATVLNNYAYYLSLRKQKLDKAKEMSARSLELQPDNASFLDTYAWVLYQLGQYEQALEYILKALKASEKPNATLLEHHGDILYKLGRREEAWKQWKEARNAGEGSEFLERKAREGKLYE
ncbi:MAG: tetratricopeptide repeat protein [Bacteroidetes bacterium]|nr:tetratricopeptide repeat protein [Bacteroidota bacterium]